MKLVGADIAALSKTVRSGGQIPAPKGLRSEEWRRRQAEEEEAALLPDWFPRTRGDSATPSTSEHGFVRDERFVDYLASNFQPVQEEKMNEPDEPGDRRWILFGLVAAVVLLYCLARRWM